MQKHVNLVDLVKSFPTNIFLQNLASIQKRTSPIKFAHLAEKSANGSISNLSTKSSTRPEAGRASRRVSAPRRRSPDHTGQFPAWAETLPNPPVTSVDARFIIASGENSTCNEILESG